MSLSKDSKQKAWLEHYLRLLNIEWLGSRPPVLSTTSRRPAHPNHHLYGKEGYLTDEGRLEMIPAAGDMGASMIRDLAAAIICDGKVPSDWEQSFYCLPLQGKGGCNGKGQLPWSQTDRAGYENPGEDCGRPHQTVGVNRLFPVWLCPRQRHYRRNLCCQAAAREYIAANRRIYMTFVDLEKAFDQVPRKVICWALRKLGVEEWIVQLVQGMYANARSRVRVGEGYSEQFEVKVGVHQGSVLSPLLFIIVLEAISWEFRSGVPWEDLYTDGLVIIAESFEECVRSKQLFSRLGIEELDLILKERRLRWHGHVERSNGAVKTAFDIQADGKRGPGRPKMTWKQLTERDCREWKLSAIDPHDRHTWRSGVRSAMHATSQLPGRGPTDVNVAPVPAR